MGYRPALPLTVARSQGLHPQNEGFCPGKPRQETEKGGHALLDDCLPSWEPHKIRMQKMRVGLDEQ